MAVLKDLIVHGASKFIGSVYTDVLEADTIKANTGIFDKLAARRATVDENLTVHGLLDVHGELHTKSWSNSNIATVDGNFHIVPTVTAATATGTISYSGGAYSMSVVGAFATNTLTVGNNSGIVAWTPGSQLIVSGEILVNDEWFPLGTLKCELGGSSNLAIDAATKTVPLVNITDSTGNVSAVLETIRQELNFTGTTSTLNFQNVKIAMYGRKDTTLRPIGILLTAQGTGANKTFIDMYNGSNQTNGTYGGLAKPVVRIGNLSNSNLDTVGGQTPTGWGIYTSNGYFDGVIAATRGQIANFTINGAKLYSNDHSTYNAAKDGIYIGDDYIAFGNGAKIYFTSTGNANFGDKLIWNGTSSTLTVKGAITATSLTIGSDTTQITTSNILNTNVQSQNFSEGTMLYKDPSFANGVNSTVKYANSGGDYVSWARAAKSSDNPIISTSYEMVCKNTGAASPGLGGFYWAHASRANAVFLYRIIAKIPTGHNIQFASNATGDNYTRVWLTPNQGTGKFTEYIFKLVCGSSGSFSTTGFFYLDGTAGTSSAPVTWYVAYATVFDMTNKSEVNNYITNIDSNGIWITPSGKQPTNTSTGANATGTKIDGTGVGIYVSGTKLAQYGTTTYFYEPDGTVAASLDGNGLNIKTGTITLGSSFSVTTAGAVTASNITATGGKIGKYIITSSYLYTGSGSTQAGIGGDQAFWAGSSTSNSAPFRVSYGGVLYATGATISGAITATSLTLTNGVTIGQSQVSGLTDSLNGKASTASVTTAQNTANNAATAASNAAKTATNYLAYIDSTNGLVIASASPSSATRKVQIKSTGVYIYNDANNYSTVTSSGLTIYQGGVNVATFGSTATIRSLTVSSACIENRYTDSSNKLWRIGMQVMSSGVQSGGTAFYAGCHTAVGTTIQDDCEFFVRHNGTLKCNSIIHGTATAGNQYFLHPNGLVNTYASGYTDGQARIRINIGTTAWVSLHVGTGGTAHGVYSDRAGHWIVYNDGTGYIYTGSHFNPGTNSTSTSTGFYLGLDASRWRQLYCYSAVNSKSDRKDKDVIGTLDYAKEFIMSLQPIEYQWKDSEHNRIHMGFIAQDVAEVGKQIHKDLSVYEANYKNSEQTYHGEEVADEELSWSMLYTELIAPMVKVIQDQEYRIQELEKQLNK